jgi:putative transposase
MPRKPRMYLPGVPAHIVQRGNNREACFYSDDDYLYYLEVLGQGLRRYGAKLHAYCLMTNHALTNQQVLILINSYLCVND